MVNFLKFQISRSVPLDQAIHRWVILVFLVLLLNLVGLGSHGLLEPDEGRYANMAMEFLEFGEHPWYVPILSDVGHFDKPPLIYWITGGCFRLFGLNETAARLPSFLGSLLALLGVGLLAFRQYGEKSAFWAVIVCATSLQFWALAHLLSPDMLLCGFCILGASLVLWGGLGNASRNSFRHHWFSWSLGAVCWSLAWWTKATSALVPLGALTVAFILTGRKDLLASLRPIRLLLVILVLGCPWYLAMINQHENLFDFFIGRELVGRVLGHVDGRRGFLGFHFGVALGFWLPWWPLLLRRAWRAKATWLDSSWKERCRQWPWEVVAAIAVLLIFSFISSKLITYTLAGVPLLAVYLGYTLKSFRFPTWEWPTVVTGVSIAILGITLFVIPSLEFKLGRNSSTRRVALMAKTCGADVLICDTFRPGLEFYGGELVWYVGAPNLKQVEDVVGQNPAIHFVDKEQISERVRDNNTRIWLIQTRHNPEVWEQDLIARARKLGEPMEVGSFTLWQVR